MNQCELLLPRHFQTKGKDNLDFRGLNIWSQEWRSGSDIKCSYLFEYLQQIQPKNQRYYGDDTQREMVKIASFVQYDIK